jgi:ectoine hydroxylase-related dioxygenase (phytanoyl-CoA dioxygenase family)
MTTEDRYLFDLRGYLVVRHALTRGEVRRLNAAIDALPEALRGGDHTHVHRGLTRTEENGDASIRASMFDWGAPFRELVGHPSLNGYLVDLLGEGFRLDHQYAVFQRAGGAAGPANPLHNGGTPYNPTCAYVVRDGRIHNNLLVVSIALTDVEARAGGFCCIPGSHKSEFPLPPRLRGMVVATAIVEQPVLAAGDALIFTEALTHGALPWTAAHERRAVLLKYSAAHVQWHPDPVPIDHDWTPAQLRILRPPYVRGRGPSGGDRGSLVRHRARHFAVTLRDTARRRLLGSRYIDSGE